MRKEPPSGSLRNRLVMFYAIVLSMVKLRTRELHFVVVGSVFPDHGCCIVPFEHIMCQHEYHHIPS